MTLAKLTDRQAVLDAMAECDRLGDIEFLSRHGFGRAHRYRLVQAGRSHDSKAIAGVAHGYQFPASGPLRSADFQGGLMGAAGRLRRLGFDVVDDAVPSEEATGAPGAVAGRPGSERAMPTIATRFASDAATGTVLLLGCVKGKRSTPAPAADLYTSATFLKRRAYAEASGRPWFILSALHGLLRPDQVIEPYDMAFKDQSVGYRRLWGTGVVDALPAHGVRIDGTTFEVHAGDAYAAAIRGPIEAAGGSLQLPLAGLRMGEQLSWYGMHRGVPQPAQIEELVVRLTDRRGARAAAEFPWGDAGLASPGLYAWWVDEAGARELSAGLDAAVSAGLVYIGQAGATSWPSGGRSDATLLTRIGGNHLRGRVKTSTWRQTLASVLVGSVLPAPSSGWDAGWEAALTRWMTEHLSVVTVSVPDPRRLGALEHYVLLQIDPPLNLRDVTATPMRGRVSALRRMFRETTQSGE